MTLPISDRARRSSEGTQLVLNMILDVEGVTDKYGLLPILRFVRVGDDDLLIGDDWVIGGQARLPNQSTSIMFDGTTTSIAQKLDIDKGSGSSVSQVQVVMADLGEEITRLITPGEVIDDILGANASVWLGFGNDNFPGDYARIFRGIIDKVVSNAGRVTFQISHPDQKKRQDIFIKATANLDGSITDSQTTITLVGDLSGFMVPVLGPNGGYDTQIKYGVRIEDEIVWYTGISGQDLTGCTRGALVALDPLTLAKAHDDQQEVDAFIQLGAINCIDLALKIMLSGWGGPYQEGVAVKNFVKLGDSTEVPDAVFFQEVDVADEYGVVVGDYCTITGATLSPNNISNLQIDEIFQTDEGSYVVFSGADLVLETGSSAVISFRSQYDTFNAGASMQMHNKEVDITQHELIKRRFLSDPEYLFYIRDTITAKDFLEQQIYFPVAAYSLPRKSRASVGYHIGPLPDSDIKVLDDTNTVGADKLSISRSINQNFYNTIIYEYEETVRDEDEYLRGFVDSSGDSRTRIPGPGIKALEIPAKGIRDVLSGLNIAQNASSRRLRRYKFGAELIDGHQPTLGYSFNVEIGDILVVDLPSLQISDTKSGTRNGKPRLFEVINKTFNIKTGNVTLSLLDTAYSTTTRYCLMSPSSRIDTGSTATKLKLKRTGNSLFGPNEGGKWSRYLGIKVRVRSNDFTTRNAESTIESVSGNTVTLSSSLGFTPSENDTLTIANYDEITGKISDRIKLVYGFMRDSDFGDGTEQYQMI